MTAFVPPVNSGPLLFAAGLSAAIFLVTLAATAALRSPDLRHRLWFLAFGSTVMVLGLGMARWQIPLPILPSPHALMSEPPSAPLTAVAQKSTPEPRPIVSEKTRATNAIRPESPAAPTGTSPAWNIPLLVWAAGTSLALLPLFLGIQKLRAMLRRCKPCTDPYLQQLYDHVCRGIPHRPRLLLSPDIGTPLLASVFRPCLVLPERAPGWPREQVECAFLHELAHNRRRDLAVYLFCRITAAFLWFQPLAWYGLRRLKMDAEMAADDAVLLGGSAEPTSYAETLLELRRFAEISCHLPGLGIARATHLPRRIHRILDESATRQQINKGTGRSLAFAVLGATLLISLLKPVTASPTPDLLNKIARENQKMWEAVDSLHFVSKDSCSNSATRHFDMEWWERGSRCLYRYRQIDEIGEVDFGMSYSYDGRDSRRIPFKSEGNSRQLHKRRGPRNFGDWIVYRTFPTTPLEFVFLVDGAALETTPQLALLKDPANWQKFLEDSELLGTEIYHGRKCVAVKVRNRFLRSKANGRGYYVAYFDPEKDYRPLGWQGFRENGKLFAELLVAREEMIHGDSGRSIVLPREIKTFYPATTWTTLFSEVSIDSLDSFEFALDETLVKYIFDEDTDKFREAPKQPFLSVVLPDIDLDDIPLDKLLQLLSSKAKEADPERGSFGESCVRSSDQEWSRFSIKMSSPTVGAVLAEMKTQVQTLEIEIRPGSLFVLDLPP